MLQTHAYSLWEPLKCSDFGFSLPASPCVIGSHAISGTFQMVSGCLTTEDAWSVQYQATTVLPPGRGG